MSKNIVFLSTACLLIVSCELRAETQSDLPRMEVGAYFTSLHLRALQEWPGGFGGRFDYNVLPWMALEGEFNYFPVKKPKCISPASIMGFDPCRSVALSWAGESQALFGIKAGVRVGRFGFFGKIKPGFLHLTDRQNLQLLQDQSRFRLALDIGGVLEYYLSSLVALRVDMGETFLSLSPYTSTGDYAPQPAPNWGFQAGAGLVFMI